ncbi:MAG: hypothetical protein NTW60_02905 [Candidatus Wolfebacteria bacterium]|nr:hypothetical protein [Candidatus Wolfebacteria bacterium]
MSNKSGQKQGLPRGMKKVGRVGFMVVFMAMIGFGLFFVSGFFVPERPAVSHEPIPIHLRMPMPGIVPGTGDGGE